MKEYTDQKFFYKAVPVDYDGIARLKRIKGNSIAFNQLARYTNHANATVCGLTITNNNNGSFKINGTYNASGDRNMYGYISIISAIQGHKYLVKSTGSLMGAFVYGSASGNRDATTYIVTASSSGNMETAIRLIDSKANNGQVVNETIWVNIFDLTQMFGAGKEPIVNEFKSLFPLPYYSYQSTLLPFMGTSIKTVGKNLLENKGVASINLSGVITTKNDDGSITVNGTANGNNVYSFNSTQANVFDLVLPSGNYKMVIVNGGANDGQVGIQRSGVNSYVYTNANGVANFTVQNGDLLRIAFYVTSGKTYNTTLKAMICSADADNTFEPYTSSTTNLPTLTYFPNGMKSAGNVYDELLPNKAITRVGMVDLGSLNWNYVTSWGSGNVFSSVQSITGAKLVGLSEVSNILSSRYITVSRNDNYSNYTTGSISMNDTGLLQIRDSSYTSASAFKTAMSNVYLYYELATPIELPTLSLGD